MIDGSVSKRTFWGRALPPQYFVIVYILPLLLLFLHTIRPPLYHISPPIFSAMRKFMFAVDDDAGVADSVTRSHRRIPVVAVSSSGLLTFGSLI